MRFRSLFPALLLLIVLPGGAQPPTPLSALAKMPVREVTVFKDGHAFMLHSASMPVNAAGEVQLDYLPTPVLGTFWPYSTDKNIHLNSVVASQRRVTVERTALNLREMLEANIGADITFVETGGTSVSGKLLAIPKRNGAELEVTDLPNASPRLPEAGSLVVVKTAEGITARPIERIQSLTVKENFRSKSSSEEFRNLLTLKLDWPGGKIGKTAEVGMLYVQKGIRWIPNYKVSLDGKGEATIKLQATLINELTDLDDVTMHLVVGVPTFAFQDSVDPISLQQTFGPLSQNFYPGSQTAYAFSNGIATQSMAGGRAIMGQSGGFGGGGQGGGGEQPVNLGPEIGEANRSEDLFLFNVKHVTLKKGQRMVVPVNEFKVPYKDIYILDIPFAPPPELRNNFNSQQAEIARMMAQPKVMHKIRLRNTTKQPFTTAPAMITRDDRVLAQGMMTYTAAGGDSDLTLTTAVEIRAKKTDMETARNPNAVNWQGNNYGRIDLSGTIDLKNFMDKAVEIEVVRSVLGNTNKVDKDGKAEMLNAFEDDSYLPSGGYPSWWSYSSMPYYWWHFNGIGRITWKQKLEPGKAVKFSYTWYYYAP